MTKTFKVALVGAALLVPAGAGAFPGHGDPAEMEALRTEVFAEADVDGDGALSVMEFVSFHELIRARIDEKRFAKLDADGSGGVTLEELEAMKPHRGRGPRGGAGDD
jgi:hypothetical protein